MSSLGTICRVVPGGLVVGTRCSGTECGVTRCGGTECGGTGCGCTGCCGTGCGGTGVIAPDVVVSGLQGSNRLKNFIHHTEILSKVRTYMMNTKQITPYVLGIFLIFS